MHDIGGLIWVIIVVLAVFSSIRKSVRQARESAAQAQQRPPATSVQRPLPEPVRPAQASAPPVTPLQRALQLSPIPAPPVPPPPQIRVVPPLPTPAASVATPQRPPAHDPFRPESIQRRPLSGLLGGIFEDKDAILRAVVAAEILGKPKALQEQSIWSPRHNEPSI